MRKLAKDEAASKSLETKGNVVTAVHTVKPNKESETRFELVWHIDFDGVKKDELLKLAARTVVIKLQQDWRQAKDRTNAQKWDKVTFKVREILDRPVTRNFEPTVENTMARAKKLSKAEKAELLKQLQAEISS